MYCYRVIINIIIITMRDGNHELVPYKSLFPVVQVLQVQTTGEARAQ